MKLVDTNIHQAQPQFQQASWIRPQFAATEITRRYTTTQE